MDTRIRHQDVVVPDEVDISLLQIVSVSVLGARPVATFVTVHGIVSAADEQSLYVRIGPDHDAIRIRRVDIAGVKLAGSNSHRPSPRI
jgi:hypothetical protein